MTRYVSGHSPFADLLFLSAVGLAFEPAVVLIFRLYGDR